MSLFVQSNNNMILIIETHGFCLNCTFLTVDNVWDLFDSFKIFKSKFLTEKICWENKLIKIY